MVEQVVELKPDLKNQPLGYVRVLVDSHICLNKGWIAKCARPLVAVRARSRQSKLPGREASRCICAPRGPLLITPHVWIAEVIPIGEIVSSLSQVRICTSDIVCAVVGRSCKDSEWITGLINTRPAYAPPAGC